MSVAFETLSPLLSSAAVVVAGTRAREHAAAYCVIRANLLRKQIYQIHKIII